MPISEESNKISYNTDGLVREFSFNFKFLQPSNIKVSFWTKDDKDNSTESVELEEGKDYTLIYDDAEEGGFVVLIESSAEEQAQGKPKYPATPTSGTLLVARIMPLDQQAHIRPVSGFPEEVITNTFDKLVMIDQQQQEQLNRCVKVSDVSDINPEVLAQQVERIHAGIEDIVVVADHIEDVEYVAANGEDILKASEDSLANVNAAKEQAEEATRQAAIAAVYSQSCYNMLEDSREARDVATEQAGISTAQASVATEQANIATEQANIAKEQKIIVEQFSQATNDIFLDVQSIERKVSQDLEVSKGYAQTALAQAGVATEQAGIATTQADIATARADEIKQYAANASISEANALNYASEASASAYNSEISERASETSATNSKIWAEGTDEEVQALGGVHSSKTWAEIGSDAGGKWGSILGDIKDQSDLQAVLDSKADVSDIPDVSNLATKEELNDKQDTLTAGENITIEENVISAKSDSMPIGIVFPLTCSSSYVPEGCLPCDGAEYSKSQFEQLWDNYLASENVISEIINIGNNTNANGIVTNPTEQITISSSIDISNGETRIYFTTGEDVTTSQTIAIINDEYRIFINNNGFINNIGGTTTCLPNTEYNLRISPEGVVSIYTGNTLVYDNLYSSISNVSGIALSYPGSAFLGSYNFAKSYYYNTNGQQLYFYEIHGSLLNTCTYEEYEQELATYGQCSKFAVKPLEYDGSGLTIVGSPTITTEGVASGFSSSDYITVPFNFSGSSDIDFNFNWIIPSENWSGGYVVLGGANDVTRGSFQIYHYAESLNVSIFLNDNGTVVRQNVYFVSQNFAGEFKLKILKIGTSYKAVLINPTGEVVEKTYTGGYDLFVNSIQSIGRSSQESIIDLKQFKITVDGQTVFDCVSGDTFKVPTIKDGAVVQQALSDSELGKVYNAGLPNIEGSITNSLFGSSVTSSGALTTISTGAVGSAGSGNSARGISLNASLSNSIYGNSPTVQMNAVALRCFVVVSNRQINESQMNWSNWASSLQSKANKTDVDGQWVGSMTLLSNAVSAGTYTLDLSEYLPNDGNNYDVKIFGYCIKTGSTASNVYIYTAIDNLKTYAMMATASSRQGRFYSIFTVDTTRTITMKIDLDVATLLLTAFAYRRIGRNV